MIGNTRDGKGLYISPGRKGGNYEYQGEWKTDYQDGFGLCFYEKGDLYIGHWKNGKRSGKGSLFFGKGDRYTGSWTRDKI